MFFIQLNLDRTGQQFELANQGGQIAFGSRAATAKATAAHTTHATAHTAHAAAHTAHATAHTVRVARIDLVHDIRIGFGFLHHLVAGPLCGGKRADAAQHHADQ